MGAQLDVLDPATDQVVGSVPDLGPTDALAAADAAARAQPAWAAAAPRERSAVLTRAFALMTARAEEVAQLISLENGKALPDARAEVSYAAEFLRWYAEEGVRVPGRLGRAPGGGNRILVSHRPIGVAALVTPWNFPAAMVTRKVGPALAAGCTAVLKPAEQTPLTALLLADLLREAGLPDGALGVVTTSQAAPVVDALLGHPAVRMLSFTGSTEVGKLLLRRSADRVLRTAMELGGNAPFLVLEGSDVEAALDGAMVAKMRGGGQACTAANRFYVHRSLADAFSAGLAQRMGAVVVGRGSDPATGCGPLVDTAAVDKAARLVDDAVARGARLLLGGERLEGPGCFYPPTVLTDVPDGAAVLAEEVFAPVAPVVVVDDDEQAVALANDTEHGLVAYVYAGELGRALRVAERLEAGMVAVNRGLVSDPAAPFGGTKESGLGREGSAEGLLEYLETTYTAVDW
ncbi:NAD-dependent succinate-semialdehyde dehydrogenase [Streptomyces sp. NP160]|uniref:NAD-dependent succinate-semialdehyde dehydrogenase n=1 Tax=Streptomyces sp. NP160 TaxID=2586637 RepID=UPI001118E8EA|nr:NAD-dependent succinate-semialdehyde dehydrogenase [Streptomyces sp. NP160]TNM69620.1 NAD-dependent succinate-semialdehyde dehydrogenase [Streptomyces sp. NP160]